MEYSIERSAAAAKISFSVPAGEWDGFVERAYNQQKAKINVPGFRKGHAPRSLIEKMYGKSVFVDDAFNICFRESYSKALAENEQVYPVEEPKIDVESMDENGLKFTAQFAVKPEVELGAYTGLTVKKAEYPVTPADIDAEVEKSRQSLARKVEKEGAVENGDTVNLDYSGSVDGVKFDGGTASGQELVIGSGSFIPGFEEQLVGAKNGESRDINVSFPEKYHSEELAGKAAVFACTINGIFKNELPEINDELAKEVSMFDTLAEFRQDIEKRLIENANNRAKAENENALISAIVEGASVEIPDAMVETELGFMLEDLSYRLMYAYGGMKLEDYFKYTGGSEKDFRKANRDEALKNVKTRLTLEKIIATEGIVATDEDVENEIAAQAEKMKRTPEELKKDMKKGESQYMKNTVLSNKLMAFLTENNKFDGKAKSSKAAKTALDDTAKESGKDTAKPAAKSAVKSTAKSAVSDKADESATDESADKPAKKRAPCKPKAPKSE